MAATHSSNMKRKLARRKNASPPSNGIFDRKRRWIKVQKQFEGFAYDGANVRLEFVDPDGSGALPAVLTTRYFNGPGVDNIIAQENFAGSQFAQGTYWHMKNYLGSTTDLIAAAEDGGHQNHITYDSYGNVVSQTNASVGSRYMYTGRECDAETGLQYYRARYYDSSTGRFLSEDPIGFAAGPNQYGYVGGNPIGRIDPLGLIPSAAEIRRAEQRGEVVSQDIAATLKLILAGKIDRFYGNWGGAKWSGGQWVEHIEDLNTKEQARILKVPGIDAMDKAFKNHDIDMTDASRENKSACFKSQVDKETALHKAQAAAHGKLVDALKNVDPATLEGQNGPYYRQVVIQLFTMLQQQELSALSRLMQQK